MTLNIYKATDEFITVDEAILRTRNSCQNFFSYFHVFEEDFGFTRLGFYWGMKKISQGIQYLYLMITTLEYVQFFIEI